MFKYHLVAMGVHIVSLTIDPVSLYFISLIALLYALLRHLLLLHLDHTKVVEATAKESTMLLMLKA